MRAEGLLEVCCRPGCGAPTWYIAEMIRANSVPRPAPSAAAAAADAKGSGAGRKRKLEDEQPVVPPSCYNGSLPKRRGSMYYCQCHALDESECSVREGGSRCML